MSDGPLKAFDEIKPSPEARQRMLANILATAEDVSEAATPVVAAPEVATPVVATPVVAAPEATVQEATSAVVQATPVAVAPKPVRPKRSNIFTLLRIGLPIAACLVILAGIGIAALPGLLNNARNNASVAESGVQVAAPPYSDPVSPSGSEAQPSVDGGHATAEVPTQRPGQDAEQGPVPDALAPSAAPSAPADSSPDSGPPAAEEPTPTQTPPPSPTAVAPTDTLAASTPLVVSSEDVSESSVSPAFSLGIVEAVVILLMLAALIVVLSARFRGRKK